MPATFQTYRDHFTHSVQLSAPHTILAIGVLCTEGDEEAEDLALLLYYRYVS